MKEKAILTCALTGVLTDPEQHPAPVTPEQMAKEARAAYEAGAAIMHIHLRRQEPGMGRFPSWDVDLSRAVQSAIREACPGVIINHTTGVNGADISGPVGCLAATRPEIAAANAGSLNYLKAKADGNWAWPPMLFDNPVPKIKEFLDAMQAADVRPEFECFDFGIVRSVAMYRQAGLYDGPLNYNFVMGVASGMPADPDLLPFLVKLRAPGSHWQTTAIGRADVWPLHRKTAELGGHLRTGLEDTFYLPDGAKAASNGQLIAALAECAKAAGRAVATPAEARDILGLRARP